MKPRLFGLVLAVGVGGALIGAAFIAVLRVLEKALWPTRPPGPTTGCLPEKLVRLQQFAIRVGWVPSCDMQIRTIDLNKLRGLSDKFLGLAKETVGVIINNDRLQHEGDAQQERASEQLKALREEAEAEAKDAKANLFEKREKAAQRAKS